MSVSNFLKKHFGNDHDSIQKTVIRLSLTFLLFIIPVLIFAKIAREVVEAHNLPIDTWILFSIHHFQSDFLTGLMTGITNLGGVIPISLAAIIIGGLLIRFKYYQHALLVVTAVGGAAVLNFIIKLIFQRTRPDFWTHLVVENDYSFPSGHAMASSALAFAVIFILWHTKWRWLSIIVGAIFIFAVGLSRMYLGVHFPTDIVAGWCVSFAWTLLAYKVIGRVFRLTSRRNVN